MILLPCRNMHVNGGWYVNGVGDGRGGPENGLSDRLLPFFSSGFGSGGNNNGRGGDPVDSAVGHGGAYLVNGNGHGRGSGIPE